MATPQSQRLPEARSALDRSGPVDAGAAYLTYSTANDDDEGCTYHRRLGNRPQSRLELSVKELSQRLIVCQVLWHLVQITPKYTRVQLESERSEPDRQYQTIQIAP